MDRQEILLPSQSSFSTAVTPHVDAPSLNIYYDLQAYPSLSNATAHVVARLSDGSVMRFPAQLHGETF